MKTQSQVKAENITNMKLLGRDTVVTCEVFFPFVFVDIENLEIRDLKFFSCGGVIIKKLLPQKKILLTALFLNNVSRLLLENVTINRSKGYGLFAYNIRHKADIVNCLFLDGNKKCNTFVPLKEGCEGGNIALYFFTQRNKTIQQVKVSIRNCTIKGGSDLSRPNFITCKDRHQKPSSNNLFKANGLAVILAQDNYQVILHVFDAKFHQNTFPNLYSPAVLIHDYSKKTNNIVFHSSSFIKEGSLLFSTTNNHTNSVSSTIIIKSCIFINGFQTHAVHFCINSVRVWQEHFQTIAITDSTFFGYIFYQAPIPGYYNYAPLKKANIQIYYTFEHSKSYPCTLIKLERCRFSKNYVPPVSASLEQDSFLDHSHQTEGYHTILTIKYSHFEHTKGFYSPLEIIGPQDSAILWKYRKISRQNITFAEICCSNFSSSMKVSNTHVTLKDCPFYNSKYTTLHAMNSVVAVNGQNVFKQNQGDYGGALRLDNSTLLLLPNSKTFILRNSASFGGGIYATQSYGRGSLLERTEPDFFKLNFHKDDTGIYSYCTIASSSGKEQITFEDNQALFAGNSIYGGEYLNCRYNCSKIRQCKHIPDAVSERFQHLPKYIKRSYTNRTRYTEVSSPANRICLCENNKPTNKCKSIDVIAFPGQEFTIALMAVGKLNGSVPVTMTAVSSSKLNIDNRLLFLSILCTDFSFSVHSISRNTSFHSVSLTISKETTTLAKTEYPHTFKINSHLSTCPNGLPFSSFSHKCECHTFFKRFDIKCDTKKGEVQIKDNQWVGYFNKSLLAITRNYLLDYLHSGNKSINLNTPNVQCNFNRTGLLCGMCQENLSMVLGTSNCRECSNVYTLLFIPFAVAGVALVVLLLKCNLTVSVGHINGLIFYANIVQVNKLLLFPSQNPIYRVFSTYIAWVNLDLGIEVCFFKNMDTYAKAWLQFLFPVYLWVMVGLIIVLAHYSSRMGRLIGSNSVPVLATLFLLSYAKLLRIIISIVSFTFIELENGLYVTVWLQDGNVEYIKSKHVALFLVALVFALLYILPLTLLVLFAPYLQARSHYKAFRWVNKLKPFLDAYQGPYSNRFRYWTGLFLVIRILLFIIDASNYEKDPSVSFFWINIILFPFAVLCLIKRKVYRHRIANLFETISLFNLVIVCSVNSAITTTSYRNLHTWREYATYISVALMMLVLLLIMLYQVLVKITSNLKQKRKNHITQEVEHVIESRPAKNAPTCSVVELSALKEPLMDTD